MTGAPLAVLVVDDSDVLRSLVSHYLDAESDLQVVASVATTRAALEQVHRNRPDVILLDHEMPGGDGLEALPELRRLCPRARIVLFSSAVEIRSAALERGADEFVSKQSGFHELADVLRAG
jgi:two-component system chemotaxis response regulator CheB